MMEMRVRMVMRVMVMMEVVMAVVEMMLGGDGDEHGGNCIILKKRDYTGQDSRSMGRLWGIEEEPTL